MKIIARKLKQYTKREQQARKALGSQAETEPFEEIDLTGWFDIRIGEGAAELQIQVRDGLLIVRSISEPQLIVLPETANTIRVKAS